MFLLKSRLLFFLMIVSGMFAAGAQGQAVRVGAGVQKEIYVNEPFQYYIVLEGCDKAGEVNVEPLQKWSPRYAGGQDRSSHSVTIINNKRTEKVEKRYIMVYQLTSSQAGAATIPPVTVEFEGQTYRTNPVNINALKPMTNEGLRLEMSLSQTDCYLGQPIIMTIRWYIAVEVGDFSFSIPYLRDTDNFIVEDTAEPPGSGGKLVRFELEDNSVIARQQQGNNNLLVTFSKILIPQRAGTIQLAAPSVICQVAMRSSRNQRDPFNFFDDSFFGRKEYKRYSAHAQGAILNVKELPQEGRPSDFNGLVGSYKITTSAVPTEVNVGDPITLTIAVKGELLKAVQMPNLKAIPGFTDNFKIATEQSSPRVVAGQKEFTQTVRAKNNQVKEIPAIPLSYFDVTKGKYDTAFSEPIALEVAATKKVTAQQAEGWERIKPTSEIEALRQGIAANITDQQILLKNAEFSLGAAFRHPGYMVLWAVPLLIFAGSAVFRLVNRDDPKRRQARRRSQARRKAVRGLGQIDAQKETAPEETAEILREYVGDRFDRTAQSLTARDCREILGPACKDSRVVEQFCRVLEQCEQSRFAGAGAGNAAIEPRDTVKIINQLDKNIK